MKKLPDPKTLRALIPSGDHPHLNFMRNAVEKCVTIAVALHKDGKEVFKAEVLIFGHARSLYATALALVLDELKTCKMKIDWDAASFISSMHLFSRAEIEAAPPDPLALAVLQYKNIPLIKAFQDAVKEGSVDDKILKLTAAILASSAEVVSNQLKRPFLHRFLGHKP